MNHSFEKVNTQWFDADAIRLPAYKVGRVNYNNGRSYVRLINDELEKPFRLYTSLTTAISTCSPMDRGLLEWYCKLGMHEADRQVKLSQHYGTLLHILIGEYLINNFFDFDKIEEKVQAYTSEHEYWDNECNEWANKLRYDIAAFIFFAQEHEIKPIAIENVLLSERGYGTLIDLVCEIMVDEKGMWGDIYKSGNGKGSPKETKRRMRRTAIINFKSGRHQFYRSNGIQVICEKQLFEENFHDIQIDYAFNWSPKEWIVAPDYNLKDWTHEIEQKEIDAILSLADIRFGAKAVNKKYISILGMAYRHLPISNCIKNINAEEYCRNKYTDLLGEVAVAQYDNDVNAIIVE